MCRWDEKCVGVVYNSDNQKCSLAAGKAARSQAVNMLTAGSLAKTHDCYYKSSEIAGFDNLRKRCFNKNGKTGKVIKHNISGKTIE